MIKLKSLFRRGQGPSGSSKHSSSSSNRHKSQSSTSLNTVGSSQEPAAAQQQAAAGATASSATFYPPIDPATERGVDVGDGDLNLVAPLAARTRSRTPETLRSAHNNAISAVNNANTLPHKKPKVAGATKKGQKQPKQLPANAGAQPPQPPPRADIVVAAAPAGNVMTTIAAAPGSHNSAVNTAATAVAAATNNNYTGGELISSATAAQAPLPTQRGVTATAAEAGIDLYKLNAANYQQFINNEQLLQQQQQQQQQLLEANNKMQDLQAQLERMGHEKLLLEARIAELLPYQSEVAKLKAELHKMQTQQEKSQLEVANLKYENESLRNRLRDVVNSPLSDAEKHQIIQDSQRLHSSAPASIALPSFTDNDVGTPCLTPDWDKHSSSSEISVACLQDKIIQMEETHYSTNEELQATLQELADLQAQLSDAQAENERLAEEKDVLFQTLCRQTEKLNDSRTQINTLRTEISSSERERKLLDLIKTSQEEREGILVKQEELNAEMQELRQQLDASMADCTRARERNGLLDSTVDAANAERKQMEQQLAQAKEEISQHSIEISRLSTLLENARSKIEELEQDLARGEKTDLTDLLDAARKEKDALEERVAEMQDQYSRSQAEIRRLKEQLSGVTEECKVAKNNAKCAVSHLEYRLEQLQQEKDKLSGEHQQLVESTAELQVQCKCHLEDKQQLQNLLSETQKHLGDVESKLNTTEKQLEEEVNLRKQEAEEWQQFQSDLLMTVRVANDFKTEALSAREQLVLDNKTQKEKIRLLEQQIDKLTKQQMQQNETQQSVLSTVQQEMASRRSKIGSSLNRQDSRLSVKTLIESIENNKPKVEEAESHYSSTSSLNSAAPDITSNLLPTAGNTGVTNTDWSENIRLQTTATTPATNTSNSQSNSSIPSKGPLREQQQQQQASPAATTHSSLVSNLHHFSGLNNVTGKSLISGERKDPLNMLAKNGGSKRNALLKWCQNKTVGYRNIDITNFSSSWNDGLALCAILHSYLPDRIPYDTLNPTNKRRNFSLAFAAAESVGIQTTLNINDMCQIERPDWTQVMTYVTAIYKHFET
ncbi:cytospin-A [Rhagoletis pomonella]|uniref:cytospin-A n=1 Tax=Rhagoletis pomonella TaxID=28610 RepID=UPI00178524A0|nr:cytospin-A [Rhagoletis pomonella]XP_036338824.1 cytospin-A [Rhagoletis pomonella]XP_036338825.1 cytospin-A [Rhagoletis pomonella]XP_036338826.1 cytospin-A [Rhagoletis pomonella]XP_036338827.1 cytospin-A [Rhagoletis pomonella]